ncbi:MAG TPA: PASTA domain-containing protein, partial [Puia sp.]|nr:PASTA domain-containing protein [Puia sp.]
SVYVDSMKPLQVVKQFPEADNLVKINRTIYLTINRAQAPFIKMPNLVSMSLRSAIAVLHQYGLNVGDTVFKPDFARNSVLDQQLNGETIKPGTEIQEGTAVTLVLGSGIGAQQIAVPSLIGLTYVQARARLDSFGLAIGVVRRDPDVHDTSEAYIIDQVPAQFGDGGQPNFIHMGQSIDILLGTHKPTGADSLQTPQPSAY